MSVYVDPLFTTTPKANWAYKKACHMTADTEEELHAMAERLGLKRSWFQNHHPRAVFWHYDLTVNKRRQAIDYGAVPITGQQVLARVLAYNERERKEKETN